MTRFLLLFIAPLIGLLTAAVPAWAQPKAQPKEMTVVELIPAIQDGIVRVDLAGVRLEQDPEAKVDKPRDFDGTIGTGFVIRVQPVEGMKIDVFIVTNDHVARADHYEEMRTQEKPKLYAKPLGGTRLLAELVGWDEESDLAVLKVRVPATAKENWRVLGWAPTGAKVGEDVVAVGFAQGQRGLPTVTKGIVGATDRFLPSPFIHFFDMLPQHRKNHGRFAGLIQTDAAINPGNSGGPLMNLRGEVVGVNTYGHAVIGSDRFDKTRPIYQESPGIYYARASDSARGLVEQLLTNGRVFRPALGLTVRTLTDTESHKRDTLFDCVEVEEVKKGSPAAAAGIEPGDLLAQLFPEPPKPLGTNGMLLQSAGDWNNALARCSPKATVYLRVLRKKNGFAKLETVEVQP